MLDYKDSISIGVSVVLMLIGIFIDSLWVRSGLGVVAATLLLWPFVHRRFGMTIPMTLASVCMLGLAIAFAWQVIEYGWTIFPPDSSLGPRIMAADTQAEIITTLKSAGHQTLVVRYPTGDVKSLRLALQWWELFTRAGWDAPTVATDYPDPKSLPPLLVSVASTPDRTEGNLVNRAHIPHGAFLLVQTLLNHGIKVKVNTSNVVPDTQSYALVVTSEESR